MASDKAKRLQELKGSDFEIAKGQPDIRGWEVYDTQARKLGRIKELIFDSRDRKVRYMVLDVKHNKDLQLEERRVIVPIGLATLEHSNDNVILPSVTPYQLRALPRYDKDHLGPQVERDVTTVFGREQYNPNSGNDVGSDFYQNDLFNEDNMYRNRRQVNRETYADEISDRESRDNQKMAAGYNRDLDEERIREDERIREQERQRIRQEMGYDKDSNDRPLISDEERQRIREEERDRFEKSRELTMDDIRQRITHEENIRREERERLRKEAGLEASEYDRLRNSDDERYRIREEERQRIRNSQGLDWDRNDTSNRNTDADLEHNESERLRISDAERNRIREEERMKLQQEERNSQAGQRGETDEEYIRRARRGLDN